MLIRPLQSKRRWGFVTVVETAIVMLPTLLFTFGVFEYGRFLMDWNLMNNAAREGCRFALANNTDATLATDVTTTVTTFMAGETNSFNSFTVTVSGTHSGTSYTGNNVNNLAAGDMITVTVSGQYKFLNIIPGITMPIVTLTSAVTMVCEGAT
jgi:Flp pilus assembly protein TadG